MDLVRFVDRGVRDHRQNETENASGLRRVEFEPASVSFGSPFGDRQTQARAPTFARTAFIDAVKAVEDSLPVFRGNARAAILYFDASIRRIRSRHSNRDASLLRRVFDGIIQKVDEDLSQDHTVTIHTD